MSVTIPEGIISIGRSTFFNCTGLTSITIPESVTSIGGLAFRDCASLTSITFLGNAPSLGNNAFSNISPEAKIYIELTATGFGETFGGLPVDSGLPYTYEIVGNTVTITDCEETASGELVIPGTIDGRLVTAIGKDAFRDCFDLTSITIPEGVISIGDSAFRACTHLKGFAIPGTVESIGDYAFLNCTSLTSFNVASSNRFFSSENGVLFNKEKSELIVCGGGKTGNYVLPESVKIIGNAGFGFCVSLTGIMLHDKLNTIGEYAILNCVELKDIIIPSSVKSIGDYAFRDCKNLNSILLPVSYTHLTLPTKRIV